MRNLAPHTLILAAILTLGACAPSTDTPTQVTAEIDKWPAANKLTLSENERLDAWFESNYKATIRAYPQTLTSRGIDERQDEWNNPSRSFRLEQLEKSREALEYMQASFDFAALDEDHQLSYRLFEKNVKDSLSRRKWWNHGYTYSQMRGAHSALPTFLLNQHKIKDVEDAENYLTRLETIDEVLDQHTQQARAKFEKGIAPPKFVYDFVIDSSRNIMSGNPVDADSDKLNLLLEDFRKKVSKLGLNDDVRAALYERAIIAIQNDVAPAYERIIAEMERQKAAASTDDGAWKLPDGNAYYASRLQEMTTTDMSCLLNTSPSPRDRTRSRMPSSA